MKKTKVLITGGTGLVGSYLTKLLLEKNYDVAYLSRQKFIKSIVPTYLCNYKERVIDENAILSANIIIHLAGANIAEKRWTKTRKQVILESRVNTSKLIFETIKHKNHNLHTFISASAVGYYGSITSDDIFVENDLPHDDFLGKVCEAWEHAADSFNQIGVRTVKIRTGVALTHHKGALEQIKTSFKYRTKVILGSGKQYMPWIHIHDLCNIYIKAIEDNTINGSYNAVAPEQKTYSEFVSELSSFYKRAILKLRIPTFVVKFIFGDMAVVLIEGSQISVDKIQSKGFEFKYSTLKSAFTDLFK